MTKTANSASIVREAMLQTDETGVTVSMRMPVGSFTVTVALRPTMR